ncbi:MAG TPA: DUF3040 domain-containing protein [Trebonia sp.]
MSLRPQEQRILRQIEDALRACDPKLAGMLSVFTRLTAYEAIPVDEYLPVSPPARRAITGSRRDTVSRRNAVPAAGVMSPQGATSGRTRGNLLMMVTLVLVLLASAIAAECSGRSRPASPSACGQALVLARPCTPLSPANSAMSPPNSASRAITGPEVNAGPPDRAAEAAPAGRVPEPGP